MGRPPEELALEVELRRPRRRRRDPLLGGRGGGHRRDKGPVDGTAVLSTPAPPARSEHRRGRFWRSAPHVQNDRNGATR
jgi:hypothetical protein